MRLFASDSKSLVAITIKVVYEVLSNPNRLPVVLPLEPSENSDWAGGQFLDSLLDAHPPLEICGISCKNVPAQAASLHAFRESRSADEPRSMCEGCKPAFRRHSRVRITEDNCNHRPEMPGYHPNPLGRSCVSGSDISFRANFETRDD
jgi:hypothetical protein